MITKLLSPYYKRLYIPVVAMTSAQYYPCQYLLSSAFTQFYVTLIAHFGIRNRQRKLASGTAMEAINKSNAPAVPKPLPLILLDHARRSFNGIIPC
jgi:hypothetical protein